MFSFFEQGVLRFHFARGSTNYVADLVPLGIHSFPAVGFMCLPKSLHRNMGHSISPPTTTYPLSQELWLHQSSLSPSTLRPTLSFAILSVSWLDSKWSSPLMLTDSCKERQVLGQRSNRQGFFHLSFHFSILSHQAMDL